MCVCVCKGANWGLSGWLNNLSTPKINVSITHIITNSIIIITICNQREGVCGVCVWCAKRVCVV